MKTDIRASVRVPAFARPVEAIHVACTPEEIGQLAELWCHRPEGVEPCPGATLTIEAAPTDPDDIREDCRRDAHGEPPL